MSDTPKETMVGAGPLAATSLRDCEPEYAGGSQSRTQLPSMVNLRMKLSRDITGTLNQETSGATS